MNAGDSSSSISSSSGILEKPFIYGTAWKEEETKRLTRLAIEQGFRGIDTANQRKHYDEAAVGEAVKEAIRDGMVSRDELFLQTKFTFQSGQDHRLPYDPNASIADQIEQSFESSLEHLGVNYLDSYILHGPSRGAGLHANDWDAWSAMEQLHDAGRVRSIGISNVSFDQLKTLLAQCRIAPTYVQNRCYATQEWGRDVRELCRKQGMFYQAFSLLTANARILSHPSLIEIATKYKRQVTQVVFRFAIDAGMIPLTGTSQPVHMRTDLGAFDFKLNAEEIKRIEQVAIAN